jgi:hypothetical protein
VRCCPHRLLRSGCAACCAGSSKAAAIVQCWAAARCWLPSDCCGLQLEMSESQRARHEVAEAVPQVREDRGYAPCDCEQSVVLVVVSYRCILGGCIDVGAVEGQAPRSVGASSGNWSQSPATAESSIRYIDSQSQPAGGAEDCTQHARRFTGDMTACFRCMRGCHGPIIHR